MVLFSKIISDIWKLNTNQKPIQSGDTILRQVCNKVPLEFIGSDNFIKLIDHMKYIMKKYGGQGLAANQVGIPLQIIIIEFNEHDMASATKYFTEKGVRQRKMSLIPFHILVNPTLCVTNFQQDTFEEGCLSLQNDKELVPRYREVEVSALNGNGDEIKFKASGWYARILQHECHHLNGLLITDYFVHPERKKRFKW